jgi:hypothetical protein
MTRSLRHRSPASAGQIRVGVERLALYGFNRAEAHRVAAALEAELGRLASRPGKGFVAANLAAGAPVHYQPLRDPEATGRAAAQALWAGISGFERNSP